MFDKYGECYMKNVFSHAHSQSCKLFPIKTGFTVLIKKKIKIGLLGFFQITGLLYTGLSGKIVVLFNDIKKYQRIKQNI